MSYSSIRPFPRGSLPNNTLRYGSYRMITNWIHGKLGWKNRKVLPSCIVKYIRRTYPDENEDYTGFMDVVDNLDVM